MQKQSNDNQTDVIHRVAFSTLSQIGSQIVNSLLAIVMLRIITAKLGVAGYGVYATIYMFVSTFSLLTDLGLSAITSREIAKNPGNAEKIIGYNLGARLCLCTLFVPIITLLSYAVYPSRSAQIHIGIALMAVFLLFDALRTVILTHYISRARNEIVAVVNTAQQIILTLLVITVSVLNKGIYGYIAVYVLASFIGASFAYLMARRDIKIIPLFSIQEWKRIFTLSISLGAIQLINMLYLKVDSLMLSILKGSADVGIYTVAYSLILALTTLPSFIMTALIPTLAVSKLDTVKKITLNAFRYMIILAMLIVVGGITFRSDLIALVADKDFAAASTPFVILVLATAFTYLNSVLGFASVAINKHGKLVFVSLFSLIFNICLNIVAIPLYSYTGAAWSTVASEVIALVGVYIVFTRETSIKLKLLRLFVRPGLAAGLTYIFFEMINRIIVFSNHLVRLVIEGSLLCVMYVFLLLVFRAIPTSYIRLITARLHR